MLCYIKGNKQEEATRPCLNNNMKSTVGLELTVKIKLKAYMKTIFAFKRNFDIHHLKRVCFFFHSFFLAVKLSPNQMRPFYNVRF